MHDMQAVPRPSSKRVEEGCTIHVYRQTEVDVHCCGVGLHKLGLRASVAKGLQEKMK
jgi:hypothetical protein